MATELKDIAISIHTEEELLEAKDLLNNECKENDIPGLSFNIVNKGNSLFVLFKFIDRDGSNCKGGIKVENSLYETYNYIIKSITTGQEAIRQLNLLISTKQMENGNMLSFKYRWGFGNDCAISYWDYTNIHIRLSRKSVDILVNYLENGLDISDILTGLTWDDNIIMFIGNYNNYSISTGLSSELDNSDIISLLTENMLNDSDIEDIITKNKTSNSTQKLKSAYIINELGCFGAIVIWDVDYENKKVIKNILDDRVIDIENKRFVSDHSLFSRIEQRICGDTQKYVAILNTEAS